MELRLSNTRSQPGSKVVSPMHNKEITILDISHSRCKMEKWASDFFWCFVASLFGPGGSLPNWASM